MDKASIHVSMQSKSQKNPSALRDLFHLFLTIREIMNIWKKQDIE